MPLVLELNLPTQQVEEALDTLAELPFAISPTIRETSGKRASIEFSIASAGSAAQVEKALRGRGLLQARVQVFEDALV